MSYASANVQPSHGALPDVNARITTDPDKARKERAKDHLRKAEDESVQLWDTIKDKVFQPAFAGGLLSVVNVGLIGTLGYLLYQNPSYRSDPRVLGGSAVTALVILGGEGALADAYLQTEEGQAEKARVQKEGSALYRHTKEVVLRPGVFGGILGVFNVGLLGGLGYFTYLHWNDPVWDRRYVTGISAGLIALMGGQGVLAENYREKEYPKRRY